ncbi:MAG: septum formation initiator family protein [Clostridiales bacterium]|nr:septum formation initiator family protein [Clostridiales bacterium]
MARKRRRKGRNRAGIIAVIFVVMLLLLVVAYKGLELNEKNEAYLARETKLEVQIRSQEERKVELGEYSKYVQTKKYIEEAAREKLGLVYEDEIIFMPSN